jgi:hypothetical protein
VDFIQPWVINPALYECAAAGGYVYSQINVDCKRKKVAKKEK